MQLHLASQFCERVCQDFKDQLFKTKPLASIFYIRSIIYSFFIWKLLSRDYRIFGFAPESVLDVYSIDTFQSFHGYTFAGLPFIVNALNFHWIHWFIPFPSFQLMSVIYFAAIAFCLIVIVVGRGPFNLNCVVAFVLFTYLWGYNWRTGADVDAIFIPLQAALFFCFYRGPNDPIWNKKTFSLKPSRQVGFAYSFMLLIFIGYYQLSGFNKLIDIDLIEWFQYDLLKQLVDHHYYALAGWHILINPIPLLAFSYVPETLVNISVALVYFSHLFTFLMFFKRSMIAKFMYFYWTFHFVSTGLGIWFSGLLVFWLVFIPTPRFFESITLYFDPENRRHKLGCRVIKFLAIKRKVEFIPRNGAITIWAASEKRHYSRHGLLTRISWIAPLFWPLLPLIYFPLVARIFWVTSTTAVRLLAR